MTNFLSIFHKQGKSITYSSPHPIATTYNLYASQFMGASFVKKELVRCFVTKELLTSSKS